MRLGEILVQLGLLSNEQLRTVLDERDLLGGRIGTQLVERGLVTTDQVSEALSRQMRILAAMQRHFDKADPSVVSMLRPVLAARYMAIPLVAARSGVKRIVVAMATPQDVQVLDDVSFALGARVEPMVASELSIARNLKRFYNLDVKLARPARPEPSPRSVTKSYSSNELPVLSSPHGPASAAVSEPMTRQKTRPMMAPADEPIPISESSIALPPPPDAAVSLEDVVHRLSVAENRDQVADIVVDFMLPRFGCGLIFLLRGNTAHVWRGFAPGVEARAIETIAFPLAMPSVFRLSKERMATFRGPPPAEGIHLHTQIWKYLHSEPPADVVVIPITIGQRVISLVYAHATDASRLPNDYVEELQAVCSAVASAFVRLIQRAKEGQPPTTLLPR
jgi:hypothetical protein